MNKCTIATCNLNQWALDFDGNLERIIASIRQAKELGARYRLGPELEICGYSCEDHFMEIDTYMHCDQSLAVLLESDLTDDLLCDIGCPILHNNVRYNCRVFLLNRKIVLIRPKLFLADDGNYREKRFFTGWDHCDRTLHDHLLSDLLRKITGQTVVPMGVGILATEETTLASEICEELWCAKSPHINFFLSGVEIISNGSGSHHELRKLDSRLTLMKEPTRKCGGAYVYANSRGCDGNRLYFDGSSLICVNGRVVAQASQFGLEDVEVISAVVDLDAIRSYRGNTASFQEQSAQEAHLRMPEVDIRHFSLRCRGPGGPPPESVPVVTRLHSPEEECAMGPACWLWDYLRRSGASGYLLPLSGGADSASVAAIVRVMCVMVAQAALGGNQQVLRDVKRIFESNTASSEMRVYVLANELCFQLLHTIYLGTTNSSSNTLDRAKRLAGSIRSYHNTMVIDDIVSAVLSVFTTLSGKTPRFVSQGGGMSEDLALQNIQARLRMVMSYLCAQLFPWLRGNTGFLLVLSSGNVDEALRGYMTKYDCSSGDLNPIGGICKGDLKRMLTHLSGRYDIPVLGEIANATPTVRPLHPHHPCRPILPSRLGLIVLHHVGV
ncbi:NAD synthetase 1, isoform CRA_d [Ochromonadaceae sp. CCMP2298]|nr:NAD synthetase 1, isoform CRA_d [Ochromonadaceae sp. CCMP2298]